MGLLSNHWKHSTLSGRVACVFLPATFIVVTVAIATPHWLEADYLVYGNKFEKLGLWVHCFRSLPDYTNFHKIRFFVGCRWVYNPFTEGYENLRGFLMPAFFVAVQVFYTFCFTLLLISLIMVIALVMSCLPGREIFLMKLIALVLLISAMSGTIAVIVFGALGDSRDWMPDYNHNYLSWSFGLAVVGTFMEYVSAILYYVEARVQTRRAKRYTNGVHG